MVNGFRLYYLIYSALGHHNYSNMCVHCQHLATCLLLSSSPHHEYKLLSRRRKWHHSRPFVLLKAETEWWYSIWCDLNMTRWVVYTISLYHTWKCTSQLRKSRWFLIDSISSASCGNNFWKEIKFITIFRITLPCDDLADEFSDDQLCFWTCTVSPVKVHVQRIQISTFQQLP